jgi:hypothetical protein
MSKIFYIKSSIIDRKGYKMSYNSKKTIVSMAAGVVIFAAYIIYALGSSSPAIENVKDWAKVMLLFIGIGIGALIVIQILFHIGCAIGIAVKEEGKSDKEIERIVSATVIEDEREKMINLKSAHIGYICVGLGFVAVLIALMMNVAIVSALHILFGAFGLASIMEGFVSIYLYERGI